MMLRLSILAILLPLLVVAVSGNEQVNSTCNESLLLEISNLQKQIEQLKAENLKLQAENQKLSNELSSRSKWDARNLMDMLQIYTLTPSGKQYKLLFHEGGLGGVIVYQYVGLWQGNAGKWRQYKQIAFFKPIETERGYMKPGIVLKPVWGFNGSKEVRITSIAELIKYENKYNSINGLAEYYMWMFNKYRESASYAGFGTLTIAIITLGFGLIVGEMKKPIGRFLDYITIRRVSNFTLTEEPKKERRFFFRRGDKK